MGFLNGLFNPGQQPQGGIANPQPLYPEPPRVPYAQNPVVTALAAGLLSGRTPQKGLENFGQMLPGAMLAKSGMQDRMLVQQEKADEKAAEQRRNAGFNAWVKAQSGMDLSPADIAVIEANPEMGRMLFGEHLKQRFATPDPKANLMAVDGKIFDAASGQWITPPGGDKPDPASITNITAIRKDLEDEQGMSRYRTAAPILSSMAKSVDDPSAMADLDFIYGMAKIFDPGSVVRESEMGLVIDSQSIPATIKGRLEKILNGEAVLQPQARRDLVRAAATRVQEYRTQAETEAKFFTDIATRNDINPLDVVRPLEPMTSAPGVYTWTPEGGLVVSP